MKGGSHVDYITNQITSNLATIVKKKKNLTTVKKNDIKSHLWVFVNALIDNPAFDSQTKENLTTNKGSFGSECELTPEFLKKVAKSDVMKSLLKHVDYKQNENFKKTDGKRKGKLNIPKLEDANLDASANSGDCTLILTEGDSAKALAMSGLSVVGQDYYGVFPLKGKLLNVRKATPKQLQENAEIQNIKKILGLQHGKSYENVKELRYGHLMIMADKDGTDLDLKEKGIRYRDFMNKEFKQYAMADLQRSIPSMVDGLKPRERKILFYALKKPIIQEIEVTQFSIYVPDHSPYHDGEVTLVGTIIGMAQNYVGSNNINLLQSNMQLGTRRRGGKDHDHADGTLLSTWLAPITQYLFHKDDELLLDYYKENGQSIEPAWFIPIIPMVLVNGSEARGALSSFIPNYNPRDIIANLKRLLEGKSILPMLPCYRGFIGDIKKSESASNEYTTYGIIREDKEKEALTITELPVRCWTEDYREFLEAASRCGKDIKDYKARNGDTSVHFEITMTEDQMNKAREEGFPNKLKLTTTLSTANMYVLDAQSKLKKYDTPEKHIIASRAQDSFIATGKQSEVCRGSLEWKTFLEVFYRFRLHLYEKRKTSLPHELKIALLQNKSKERFARAVRNKELDLEKPKSGKCVELKEKCFKTLPSIKREAREETPPKEEDEDVAVKGYDGYDYLISQLDDIFEPEYIEELEEERKAKDKKIEHLTTSTTMSLWLKDLAALLDEQLALENYCEVEKKARAKRAGDAAGQSANKKRRMCIALGMCLISYLCCYPLMLFPECSAKVSAVAGWGN
ncbi:DNA topoisomerase 2 [Tanacetum coccineum]